jgi:hypothetical protein
MDTKSNRRYSRRISSAEYGHALMSNRGGWTLREILGPTDSKQVEVDDNTFTQGDFQKSLEKASRRVRPSSPVSKKK